MKPKERNFQMGQFMETHDAYLADDLDSKWNDMLIILRNAVIVGIITFLASVLGIITRPVGHLASFWPANPLLLGILLRRPHLRGRLRIVAPNMQVLGGK